MEREYFDPVTGGLLSGSVGPGTPLAGGGYLALGPEQVAKAQALGLPIIENYTGDPRYNGPAIDASLPGVRGAIGSNALFADQPQAFDPFTYAPLALGAAFGGLAASGLADVGAASDLGAVSGAGGGAGSIADVGAASGGGAVSGAGGLVDVGGAGSLGASGGLSQADLASLLESGTSGTAGAGLESAGLGGAGLTAGQVGGLSAGGALDSAGSVIPAGSTASNVFGNIPTGTNAGATNSTSALARLLGLDQNGSDLLSVLGPLLGSGLGYLGSQQQANAYEDVANQQAAIGAPYRNQLAASYQPGFDLTSQPGYGDAFQRAADISARSYSAKSGNPSGNPTAQAGILNDVWSQNYLPALTNYRGQLGQFGGLGLNTSGTASLAGAGTAGSGLNAIGYGLGSVTQPQNDIQSLLKQLGNSSLSIGGVKYG